jgi:hypothetical protein
VTYRHNADKAKELYLDASEDVAKMFCSHLEVDSLDDIVEGYEFFKEPKFKNAQEIWELPKGFHVLVEMEDVKVPPKVRYPRRPEEYGFTWGHVWFGYFRGEPVIAHQNASPIGFYYVKKRPEKSGK